MIEDIKSKYIWKKIFEFIQEKRKLKIIIYNKKIKEELAIDIINYKNLTNYSLKKLNNGVYKLYITKYDFLCYEGGFSEGKKNGFGKEYEFIKKDKVKNLLNSEIIKIFGKDYVSYVSYEGEFLNGNRNGKGKEFDKYQSVIFEGEYINGKRWNGKGIEYDSKRNFLFKGTYFKGKKWIGKAREYNVHLFDYEYMNGEIIGKEFDDNNTLVFLGEFKDREQWNGIIFKKIYTGNEYLGQIRSGVMNGIGKEYDFKGDLIFSGEYRNGERWNGIGKVDSLNFEFEGEYLYGKKWNGKCIEYYFRKIIFEGEYINGEKNGREYNSEGNLIFEGKYKNGKKFFGKEYDNNKNLIFEGKYKDGKIWIGRGKNMIIKEN